MSQKAVYELLKELGGRASLKQVSELAFKKFPEYTLYEYVGNRLRKLKRWGYVKQNEDGTWEIISKRGPPT
jgi:hypothetical protein